MNRDGINGSMPAGVPLIMPAAKFDFGELQFRQVYEQVKKAVGAAGGQVPIGDPIGVLAMGIVMDKLNEISARIERLEARPIAFNKV